MKKKKIASHLTNCFLTDIHRVGAGVFRLRATPVFRAASAVAWATASATRGSKTPGMVVGIDSGDVFDRLTKDVAVPLEPGDCILLYTDGITEALDSEGNEFGMERTIASVKSTAKKGARAIVTQLIDDLRNFVGATAQNDDITLIAIRKT